MFEEIEKKIKIVSIVIFIVESLAFVIWGFVFLSNEEYIGWLYMLLGPVIAWVSAVFSYGFGVLIEKVTNIDNFLRNSKMQTEVSRNEKLTKIQDLYNNDLISEEEYEEELSKIRKDTN